MTLAIVLLALVFIALSAADIAQSLELQKIGAVERNPLLKWLAGERPKPKVLIAYGVISKGLWLAAALFFVLKGAQGAWALFAFGIFAHVYTVVNSYKLRKELTTRS